MTKEAVVNKFDERILPFSDTEFYKWIIGAMTIPLTWYIKLSADYLKRRNKDLDQVKKDLHKLVIRFNVLEEDVKSVKRHDLNHHNEQIYYSKLILEILDKEHPQIWEDISDKK
jgi:hypothetical protein